MDADSLPLDFRFEQGRRLLEDLITAGEGQTLGSLAADLDMAPPEALGLLHRVVVQAALPIRAEFDLACPECGQPMEQLMGLAAWVLATMSYRVPCACGRTVSVEPSYLDVLLKPDSIQAFEQALDPKRRAVAETARSRSKALDREEISAIQLSFDWGLTPTDEPTDA